MTSSVLPVFLLLCVACAAMAQSVGQKPGFCRSLECPRIMETAKFGFNVRKYTEASQWVGAKLVKQGGWGWMWWLRNVESSSLFRNLFNYINGGNVEGRKMDMTAPVLIKFETFEDGRHEMSMFFYIDPKEGNPPRPNNGDVFFMTMPAGTQFDVKAFNSRFWTDYRNYERTEMQLKETLAQQGMSYNPRVVYNTAYDQPYTWSWWYVRTDEVMLEPTGARN